MLKSLAVLLVALGFTGLTPASSANAAETWLDGRFYYLRADDPDVIRADLAANFREVLPWGSRVEVHFSFGSEDELNIPSRHAGIDWSEERSVTAIAIAPYTWAAYFGETIAGVDPVQRFTRVRFLYVIYRPDGEYFTVQSSTSVQGFFEARLPDAREVDARSRNEASYTRLPLTVATRP